MAWQAYWLHGRASCSLWDVFWRGGTLRDRTVTAPVSVRPDVPSAAATAWGVTVPWNLAVTIGLGAWLMLAPTAWGSAAPAAHSDHLVGALIITASVTALADVGRAVRFLNVLLGAWVVISPWLLTGATGASAWTSSAATRSGRPARAARGPSRARCGDVVASRPGRSIPSNSGRSSPGAVHICKVEGSESNH